MQNTSLRAIEDELQRLDPDLKDQDQWGFRTAVVLFAAALVTGPNTERLVAFTGYPQSFVADISRRMHDSGFWANSEVSADHWFDGDTWTAGIWVDSLVAQGLLLARQREDGKWEYRVRNRKEVQ